AARRRHPARRQPQAAASRGLHGDDERRTTNDERRTTTDHRPPTTDKETRRQGDKERAISNLQSPRATDNGPRTTDERWSIWWPIGTRSRARWTRTWQAA